MFSDLESALPTLAQADLSNCFHYKLWPNGLSRHGRQRFKCSLCGRGFTETTPNKHELKREQVARALLIPGAMPQRVAVDLGVSLNLVYRVRKILLRRNST